MTVLIAFWSHSLAAALFLALLLWRLSSGGLNPGQRLLAAALAMTGCWAWLAALEPGALLVSFAETARNLIWITLLYSLSSNGEERQHGVRLVYAAVGAVLGFQLVVDTIWLIAGPSGTIAETGSLLRLTAAAGALVLVFFFFSPR